MSTEVPIDWIPLTQMALALGILSLCCWLIGITAAARQSTRKQATRKQNFSVSQRTPDVAKPIQPQASSGKPLPGHCIVEDV